MLLRRLSLFNRRRTHIHLFSKASVFRKQPYFKTWNKCPRAFCSSTTGELIDSPPEKVVKTARKKATKKSEPIDLQFIPLESVYLKKSPVEHIMIRPDSYVGTLEKIKEVQWVYSGRSFQIKECTYVPALYKIFDEILVNASDQRQRDSSMTEIRININVKENEISVYNDGAGIPVEIHKVEGVYLPEMLMGQLLTGSNFNDNAAKVTGGRNGFGAKLTNVFSSYFSVDIVDTYRKRRYQQTWMNNMSLKTEPIVTPVDPKVKTGYTCIKFKPDLELLKMKSLRETDVLSLINRRIYDTAAIYPDIKIYLNDQLVKKTFKDYMKNFKMSSYISENKRWNLYCSLSDTGQLTHLSFVNGIHTLHGGTHVNYIADQIVKYVIERTKKGNKEINITPAQVKSQLTIILSCLVENPSFDSQTKERLTTKPESFGSECILPDKFLKEFVNNSNILSVIQTYARNQEKQALARNVQRNKEKVYGLPKLDDANEAGGPKATQCTLIITEGDSAKALAVGGLSIVGRDYYGVFPIQGKLLNVRDASSKKVVENREIKDLIRVIGLNPHKTYKEWEKDSKSLRYGKIMLMADQDHDGSHIKGLFINFIHHFWPELLKRRDFLYEFITPIVKASKGNIVKSFFTLQEYEKWKSKTGDNIKLWNIKYYKGLGTNTTLEAKTYFKDLEKHVVEFMFNDGDEELIDMVFNKKLSNLRREWLLTYNDKEHVDTSKGNLAIRDFINKELISFSFNDNIRSIPSVIDGLKPSQRKVLYACFKRNLTQELKVAQLAGYVSEQASYHHGEVSLHGTIVNMAQNFVGTNNIPLLYPSGQFGTRLQGGKDAASARYIYTRLTRIARILFNPLDDNLLKYLDDDGFSIEPEHYVPIIPFVLVNGSEGLGTGWSTSIPLFNPIDIIDNIIRKMKGMEMEDMIPYYRGFKGTIKKVDSTRFISQGKIECLEGKIHITELPVGRWTNDYKSFIDTVIKDQGIIKSFTEHHTDESVHFILTPTEESILELPEDQLLQIFRLEDSILVSNMSSFDSSRTLKKYSSPLDIIDEFYDVRLSFYEKRKAWMVNNKEQAIKKLNNQLKFVEKFTNGELTIFNRPKQDVIEQLERLGFEMFNSDYNYLLSTPIFNLSLEQVQTLEKAQKQNLASLKSLQVKSPETLWKEDLDMLRVELLKLIDPKKSNGEKVL